MIQPSIKNRVAGFVRSGLGFFAISFILFGCGLSATNPKGGEWDKKGEVVCMIEIQDTIQKVGEEPRIRVFIQNNTDSTIALPGSLDGSDVKWRTPYCYFEISKDGTPLKPDGFGRCGMMNGIRPEDYVVLDPGEKFDPFMQVDNYGFFSNYMMHPSHYLTSGTYTFQFFYSNYADTVSKEEFYQPAFIESSSTEEDSMNVTKLNQYRQMEPMIKLTSNEVTIVYKKL